MERREKKQQLTIGALVLRQSECWRATHRSSFPMAFHYPDQLLVEDPVIVTTAMSSAGKNWTGLICPPHPPPPLQQAWRHALLSVFATRRHSPLTARPPGFWRKKSRQTSRRKSWTMWAPYTSDSATSRKRKWVGCVEEEEGGRRGEGRGGT